jgi:hypothetical protein
MRGNFNLKDQTKELMMTEHMREGRDAGSASDNLAPAAINIKKLATELPKGRWFIATDAPFKKYGIMPSGTIEYILLGHFYSFSK